MKSIKRLAAITAVTAPVVTGTAYILLFGSGLENAIYFLLLSLLLVLQIGHIHRSCVRDSIKIDQLRKVNKRLRVINQRLKRECDGDRSEIEPIEVQDLKVLMAAVEEQYLGRVDRLQDVVERLVEAATLENRGQ